MESDFFDNFHYQFDNDDIDNDDIDTWGLPDDEEYPPIPKIGGYSVSLIPDTIGLNRVDSNEFIIGEVVLNVLKYKYSKGFSFLICRFDGSVDNIKMHPIGYTHKMIKPGILFTPTLHIHDGVIHDVSNFDHQIFILNCKIDPKIGNISAGIRSVINFLKKNIWKFIKDK